MTIFNQKNLIQLTIFINLVIVDKKLDLQPLKLHPFYLPYKKYILQIDENKKEILQKGRNFLDKCLRAHSNKTYKYIKQPKITAIIPLYNCEGTIESALHSIQYQNISEIEILLINDFSKDNTSKILKNFQKKDFRIKVINNHKNMGTLYSRSIGVLISKGEYIYIWFRQ